ncbi:MAG: hypothetical protein WBQ24_03635 [Xanthobacteraceae bacterium]
MQRTYDIFALALAIVASLGCVSAIFYMAYHSVMIAVCYYRDTPPDQRAQTPLTYRPSTLPKSARLHHRKALMGMLAFFGFFLLILLLNQFAL